MHLPNKHFHLFAADVSFPPVAPGQGTYVSAPLFLGNPALILLVWIPSGAHPQRFFPCLLVRSLKFLKPNGLYVFFPLRGKRPVTPPPPDLALQQFIMKINFPNFNSQRIPFPLRWASRLGFFHFFPSAFFSAESKPVVHFDRLMQTPDLLFPTRD